jgi:hypothetical protein
LVAAPSGARVQRHQVTVVKSGGVRLVAWDSASKQKGVCFRLNGGGEHGAFCDRSGQHKLRLTYTSFVNKNGNATLLGGDARRDEITVRATFADGRSVTLHTVRSKHYVGRQRAKARFWAGQKADATQLVSLQAKNAKGVVVETRTIPGSTPTPGPGPTPTPNPPGCGCPGPPRAQAMGGLVVCPLTPCPQ